MKYVNDGPSVDEVIRWRGEVDEDGDFSIYANGVRVGFFSDDGCYWPCEIDLEQRSCLPGLMFNGDGQIVIEGYTGKK